MLVSDVYGVACVTMLWLMTPSETSQSADVGRLNYSEAMLFARAGDDMRRASWDSGVFVRQSVSPPAIPGYTAAKYKPGTNDLNAYDWRRA